MLTLRAMMRIENVSTVGLGVWTTCVGLRAGPGERTLAALQCVCILLFYLITKATAMLPRTRTLRDRTTHDMPTDDTAHAKGKATAYQDAGH
jgi:hypothetical protein